MQRASWLFYWHNNCEYFGVMNTITLKDMTITVKDDNGITVLECRGEVVFHSPHKHNFSNHGSRAEMIRKWVGQNCLNMKASALEKQMSISYKQADKIFRKNFQISINRYRQAKRLQNAVKILKTGEVSIKEAADICGYRSISHFCRAFKAQFGITPKECKNGKKIREKGKQTAIKDNY